MKGIYVLIINVCKNIQVKVGALGRIKFEKGLYAYVGSAQNNLEKRVSRHLKRKKKKHWHIDYLTSNKATNIKKVFYKKSSKKEECKTAKELSKTATAIPRFGSSDCNCKSHFFKIKNLGSIEKLGMKELKIVQ